MNILSADHTRKPAAYFKDALKPFIRAQATATAAAFAALSCMIQDLAAQEVDAIPDNLAAQDLAAQEVDANPLNADPLNANNQDLNALPTPPESNLPEGQPSVPDFPREEEPEEEDAYQRGYAGQGYQGGYQEGYAGQGNNVHPDGLFGSPQEGIYAQLPRTSRQAERWTDYFHLTLRASVSGETNVFLNDANKESDIIFTIAPTLSFTTPGLFSDDRTLSVAYTPSYRMYSKNSDLDGLNHSLRFIFNDKYGLQFRLPKTTISFDLGYSQSQGTSRFSNGFVESQSLSASASLAQQLSGKTSFQLRVTPNFNNFDSGNLIDDITWNFNASLMYQATGKISIGPYAGYGISNMSGSAGGIQNTQDRHSYSAGVRVNYQASGRTAFTGSFGWSTYEFDGPGSGGVSTSGKGKDTYTYRMGVSHQLSPKISLRGSLWRSFKPSNNIANTAYTATGASLSAAYSQSDRWSHFATFTYENDDYFSDDPAGGSLNNDYYRVSLGTRYRFNNGLNLGANISSSAQSSSEGANNFDNWIFSLYAQYTFF